MIDPRRGADLTEDAAAFERPLFEVFAEIAARQPDHLAVDDGTSRLTYAELQDQALALGARIAALVPADGLVGVLLPTTALYPVAWLACLAARRAFLPLDPHLPPARNQAIIAEAGLAAAIVPPTTTDLTAWLPAALPRIIGTPDIGVSDPGPANPRSQPAAPDQNLPPAKVGMVVFTSGSTGRAKGIALHERSMLRRAMHDRATCGFTMRDHLLSLHPPPTSAGVRDTLAALLSGATLHLVDLRRDGLAPALATLQAGGITWCAAVPVVARALLAMEGAQQAFGGLRMMRLGGDVVMGGDVAALARRLAPTARILLSFGMSEAGVLLERMIDARAPIEPGRIAAGAPVRGQTITVERANGMPAKPGETGAMVIRGRYLALGYWVAGQLDSTQFPADRSTPDIRCFRSADLVLLRPDGMLMSAGRSDRQVKINGIRVEPEETEAALRSLPDIADAAVLVQGEADTPMLVAFVVPAPREKPPGQEKRAPQKPAQQKPGGMTRAERNAQPAPPNAPDREREWRSALTALLPPQQVPARIHLVPAIPLLPSLKADLTALRALLAVAEEAPGRLARLWARCVPARLHHHTASRAAARALRPLRRDSAVP